MCCLWMPETTHVISKRWDTRMKYHVLMNLFDEMGILMKWVSCLMDVYVYVPSESRKIGDRQVQILGESEVTVSAADATH